MPIKSASYPLLFIYIHPPILYSKPSKPLTQAPKQTGSPLPPRPRPFRLSRTRHPNQEIPTNKRRILHPLRPLTTQRLRQHPSVPRIRQRLWRRRQQTTILLALRQRRRRRRRGTATRSRIKLWVRRRVPMERIWIRRTGEIRRRCG